MSAEATLFRIRWSTLADLPALTNVFARASLSNEGDRHALLAHPEALVLEGDGIAGGQTRVATNFAEGAQGIPSQSDSPARTATSTAPHMGTAPRM